MTPLQRLVEHIRRFYPSTVIRKHRNRKAKKETRSEIANGEQTTFNYAQTTSDEFEQRCYKREADLVDSMPHVEVTGL